MISIDDTSGIFVSHCSDLISILTIKTIGRHSQWN